MTSVTTLKDIRGNVVKARRSVYFRVGSVILNENLKKCESTCFRTFHIVGIQLMFASFSFEVAL